MKPYSDKEDGRIQLSFSLNCKKEVLNSAVTELCHSMNLINIDIVSLTSFDNYHTIILYATVNFDIVESKLESVTYQDMLDRDQIITELKKCNRAIRILGAATGTDSHTVGLDSIFNKKGYHGDYGFESYPGLVVYNMGAQITPKELVAEIKSFEPDVICISQTVSQNDFHIRCLKEVLDEIGKSGLERKNYILICGGMKITDELAKSLGYDAGFNRSHTAIHALNFIYKKVKEKSFILHPLAENEALLCPLEYSIVELKHQLLTASLHRFDLS